ncbi:hypothetical protein CC2G_014520 [Coprinopsis cinerea AmutBmut pab1-1]|nr:hypothetical protein CC2G_014520 [Coprinopsis cinerea AmutBmut pab1-1]
MTSSGSTATGPREDVFSNEDLLDIVCGFLLDDPVTTEYWPRQQLLRLALTGKVFLQPALKALWSRLDGLLPLLKLLSGFTLVSNVYVMNGGVDDEQWANVRHYGRLVRSIRFARQTQKVSSFVYQHLSVFQECKPGRRLLANLRKITVECNAECDYPAAFLAIQSGLEKVEIRGVGSDSRRDVEFLQQFLLSVSLRATNLKGLILEGRGDDTIAPIFADILNFTRISRLDINLPPLTIPLEFLRRLGKLTDLASLSIATGSMSNTVPPQSFRAPKDESSSLPPFPTLKMLSLQGASSGIARALSVTSSGSVQSVELTATSVEQADPQQWRDCFHHISEGCSQLRSIKVTQMPNVNVNFTLPMIEPLLDLSTLSYLHLKVYTLSGGNSLISAIANSCPKLVSLVLPSLSSSENPDITCLPLLEAGCPELLEARLCFTLRHVEMSELGAPGSDQSQRHGLQILHISNAGGEQTFPIATCLSIASWIDALFPSLVELNRHLDQRGQGRGSEQTLQDIRSSLFSLKSARERERSSILARPKDSKAVGSDRV